MAGKKRNRHPTLVLDESVQGKKLSAFERYASVRGILYGDVLEVSKTSPGMPDDLLIQKYLNGQTILLTTDRPFHNKALNLGLRSFLVQPDLRVIGKPLRSVATEVPVQVGKHTDPDSVAYRAPESRLRAHLMPVEERALKKLKTKRRRIRNHFGGLHNVAMAAVTLSVQGGLVGIRIKVSSNAGHKAITGSENYIRAGKGGPEDAFCYALVYVLQLQLHGLRVQVFYDHPALPNPATLDDPFLFALKGEFRALEFVETPKGPEVERLRRKLGDLRSRPSNEIVAPYIHGPRTRVLEAMREWPDEAPGEAPSEAAVDPNTDRGALLLAAAAFVEKARGFEEVLQVALIGSLATKKTNPKDLDLMVSVAPESDLKRLAKLGRQTQGRVQRGGLGVDIFLVENGKYIGRTCSYREPNPRMLCTQRRLSCDLDRCFLCHTSESLTLKNDVVEDPPIILHPAYSARVEVPDDVKRLLVDGADPAATSIS